MLSSDGVRITDLRSFSDVLQDEERIKKMTGIDLSENFELEGHHLILMERCLSNKEGVQNLKVEDVVGKGHTTIGEEH
ncbi:hypothetical protein SUGI_1008950 [Cryptomeria japonica]|nr:hypothetical protein SUGI_1008950 [Cryptomeria japonica]